MMRAETAERSFSRLESFLRRSLASRRKGSSSLPTRSAFGGVKRRCGGSGVSSCSGSSSSSAMGVRWSRFLTTSTTTQENRSEEPRFLCWQRVGRSMLRRYLMLAQREHAVESQTGEVAGAFVDGDAVDDIAGTEAFESAAAVLRGEEDE